MGLDMYFERSIRIYNSNLPIYDRSDLYYFRKHSDLHGWLMERWLEKNPGCSGSDFNAPEKLEIDQNILDELEEYANQDYHRQYPGFFWGESEESDWKDTREKLIPLIRQCLDNNLKVHYIPSW